VLKTRLHFNSCIAPDASTIKNLICNAGRRLVMHDHDRLDTSQAPFPSFSRTRKDIDNWKLLSLHFVIKHRPPISSAATRTQRIYWIQ
jgi:hypothetical protein